MSYFYVSTFEEDFQKKIDEAKRVGAYLETDGDEYSIEPFFRSYLLYKQQREVSPAAIDNIYYNAGLYYELQSEIKQALKYYSMCKNSDKIKALLVRNSNLHPGVAQYLEVEEYYRAFPKEEILGTPELMCGMCMLCSLNMHVEESEEWYQHLRRYFQNLKKTDLEYKYVREKLHWLDISLPHRGSANMEALLEAQEYHFVRMVAEEGAAVLPLLLELQVPLNKSYKKALMQTVKEEKMMYSSYLKGGKKNMDALTTTEKQVLKLIGRGMKNKEIAEFLNMSLNTVGYHTKNIYHKLEINNRSQATNIAKGMEV